ARFNGGLALISGPMRSGRTTTVASMIQRIIDSRPSAVLTVENPVEFDLISKGSVISHREIGRDVISLETAVEALGKEDFDICFFGDVTGKSAFRAVAQSSITGVMTFACTYANSASETLDHFFAGFDESERSWVARMVSNSLRFVINQKLIPGVGGRPVLASELLLPTPSIRKAIRAENFDLINESILADGTKAGMVTMNQSLMNLLVKRKIELRNAFESSPDPDELDQMLKKAGI
ncbi:MAG: Flp pilus assembly complex ATPase component TadA, partial [Bdellovibrionales bacterium]|nr:Flp pilus assembly complex ATPase component TadA [Bdellovibrionales bacterium]